MVPGSYFISSFECDKRQYDIRVALKGFQLKVCDSLILLGEREVKNNGFKHF
jgi:hypothetical protein